MTTNRGNKMTGRNLIVAAAILLLASLSACTSLQWQADQIDRNIDHITQEQILSTFGQPDAVLKGVLGGAKWVYHYRTTSIGGAAAVGKVHCWENVLLFDRAGVLRNRERRSCSTQPS